jgi:hypothetical protein
MLCRTRCFTRWSSKICWGSLLRGVLPIGKVGGDLLTGA